MGLLTAETETAAVVCSKGVGKTQPWDCFTLPQRLEFFAGEKNHWWRWLERWKKTKPLGGRKRVIWTQVCRAAELKGGEEESPGHHPICPGRWRLGDAPGTCLLLLSETETAMAEVWGKQGAWGINWKTRKAARVLVSEYWFLASWFKDVCQGREGSRITLSYHSLKWMALLFHP